MLMLQDQGPIFIVLDGIDECPNRSGAPSPTRSPTAPREKVLELVAWLSGLRYSHLSICVTSRPEADIQLAFKSLALRTVCLHTEKGQTEDIVNYIKWFINSDTKMQRWGEKDKELVIETLPVRADGM